MTSNPPHPIPASNISSREKFKSFLATTFFAVLFFLCSADQFFTVHLAGFNFRWGQLLLLGWVFFSLGSRKIQPHSLFHEFKPFFLSWTGFFITYAVSAFHSPAPSLTLTKWLWAFFNIGLAFALFSREKNNLHLEKGFRYGILAIALLLWTQSILNYWFHAFHQLPAHYPSVPITLPLMGFTIVIGFAQPEAFAPNHFIIRPNAFYYEPSYAGCALAFSFLLLLASFFREKNWSGYWIPAVVLGAIVLTTSRGGILGLALGILTLAASFFFIRPRKELIVFLSKTVGLGLLLLLLFSIAPFGREYLTTLSGTEGVQASVQRMKLSSKSEGGRVDNFQNGISQWNRHLWLGDGAQTDPHDKKLFPAYENTWLEIGLESGLMGFLAFLFAVGSTILGAFQGERLGPALKLILAAAWIVHFGINLNLCQTFPRLDFWLLFYFSIYLLTKPNMEKA